ncbi:MAG: ferritin-like domain-containing protein [Pseudonocardia sp.]
MAGEFKIFPRNLTARADAIVRGNPATTRPESGVDNCYPGLEFDQRNLDKAFFPGLLFEFHRQDGALLVDVLPGGTAAAAGLRTADLPLYLWAVLGRTSVDQSADDPPVFFSVGLGGLDVWRQVHDLLPGRIAILLGPQPGATALPPSDAVVALIEQFHDTGGDQVQRAAGGAVRRAVLTDDRARYLDDDGVIDVDAYEPGELTRSLCAPWQYDFRDCGCFYWAASKPDIVTSGDGAVADVNFQRRDRAPTPDVAQNSAARRGAELDYGELVTAWNELPVVVNDRETDAALTMPGFSGTLLTRAQAVAELTRLATVEHALAVEYLYAHYSLDAPMILPANPSAQVRRIFAAASEVFTIAVDEMRHLRWANEALTMLGEPASLGRAESFPSFDRPFELAPLTPEQLQWFIDVEAPSQSVGQGLDGMYVRLHASIDGQPELFPERDRLVHLLKLIISEGQDHFARFRTIQGHLAGLAPADYLRPLADPPTGPPSPLVQAADQHYTELMRELRAALGPGDRAGGIDLAQSRTAMQALHETNHLLAAQGVKPRFERSALDAGLQG